jgi:Leucine Rich repeat
MVGAGIPAPALAYGPGYDVAALREKKKAKNKKPKLSISDVYPSGRDDGNGARKLMTSYVDEIIARKNPPAIVQIPKNEIEKTFYESSFVEKAKHPHLQDIPMLSQLARQEAIWPTHTTSKRKLIIDICNRLKRNDGSLVRARMSSEQIDDGLLGQVSAALEKNIYLQHIMLHDNTITDKGLETLCLSVRWHPSLHTIWLGHNQISDIGAQHIAALLRRNHNIKDINLSTKWPAESWSKKEQTMHPHVTHIGADYLARSLQLACGLTSLSLAHQRILDTGANMIFQSLKPSTLRVLNLKDNHLTNACCGTLKTMLQSNCALEKLDLSVHQIDCDGTALISQGLVSNSILQALDLSKGAIGDRGMKALLDALELNHVLSILSTIYNVSSDDRADIVVSMRKAAIEAYRCHPERVNPRDLERATGNSTTASATLGDRNYGGDDGLLLESRPFNLISSAAVPPFSPNTRDRLDRIASGVSLASIESRDATPDHQRKSTRDLVNRSEAGEEATFRHDVNFRPPSSPDVGAFGRRPPSRPLSIPSGSPLLRGRSTGNSRKSQDRTAKESDDADDSGSEFSQTFRQLFSSSSALTMPPLSPPPGSRGGFSRQDSRDGEVRERSSNSPTGSRGQLEGPPSRGGRVLLSRDLGRTRGVPNITNYGALPIRSATTRFRDSAQHLMYLRVSTPDDPPDVRPYSLIQVALDQKAEIDRIRKEHQTEEYKEVSAQLSMYVYVIL